MSHLEHKIKNIIDNDDTLKIAPTNSNVRAIATALINSKLLVNFVKQANDKAVSTKSSKVDFKNQLDIDERIFFNNVDNVKNIVTLEELVDFHNVEKGHELRFVKNDGDSCQPYMNFDYVMQEAFYAYELQHGVWVTQKDLDICGHELHEGAVVPTDFVKDVVLQLIKEHRFEHPEDVYGTY